MSIGLAMTDSPPRHPVFVVGMPRSGTTLLSSMLDAHSDLVIAPETHYFTRCWTGEPLSDATDAQGMLDRLFQQPGVADMALSAAEREAIHARVRSLHRPSHADVLRAVTTVFAARTSARAWGEKTPDHLRYVPEMARQFPEAVFVAIVRDPRDVCLSLQSVPWNRDTLPEQAWTWRSYVERMNHYRAAYPDRFYDLRYEDLITNPKRELRAVCDFLAMPFEPAMLAFHQQEDRSFDAHREPWKEKTEQAVDPTNQQKWRTQMPEAERVIVELIAGNRLESYDYASTPVQWRPSLVARVLAHLVRAALQGVRRSFWKRTRRGEKDSAAPIWMDRR